MKECNLSMSPFLEKNQLRMHVHCSVGCCVAIASSTRGSLWQARLQPCKIEYFCSTWHFRYEDRVLLLRASHFLNSFPFIIVIFFSINLRRKQQYKTIRRVFHIRFYFVPMKQTILFKSQKIWTSVFCSLDSENEWEGEEKTWKKVNTDLIAIITEK